MAGLLVPKFARANPRTACHMARVTRAAFTMGSIVTVTAYCQDEARSDHAIDAAFREMKVIDRLMSVFDPASQLSRVNREAGRSEVSVDRRLVEVVRHAQRYHAMTHGAFDITVEPLMELYGFRDEKDVHKFPTDAQIASTLKAVGMGKVVINSGNCSIGLAHPGAEIDLGGIAVGFALDRAVDILRSNGIESALINHSGDIYALGAPPDDNAWTVEIVDPIDPENTITGVKITDQALSTSGNYRNFLRSDGKTIGHLIDPQSGRSASEMLSATAVAEKAIEADALSTGVFVLGPEQGRAILRNSPTCKFITILTDGSSERIVEFGGRM